MQFSHEEVNSLPAQDECESLETLFANVDLGFAEKAFRKCFHTDGPGRPPRKPLGLFRAFIVMHIAPMGSLRRTGAAIHSYSHQYSIVICRIYCPEIKKKMEILVFLACALPYRLNTR
jgi:hypothetical protein